MIDEATALQGLAMDQWSGHVREEEAGFFVAASAYTDSALYAREMEQIFETLWVYVGHESEVRHPGEYVTAWMGRQPIIVARTKDGELAGLVNACRHRGTVLCRDGSGSTNAFRCPYHGWTYALDGRLIGITDRKQYPDGLAQQLGGLLRVPHLESYRGLVFAALGSSVPSLDAYLGPIRAHIDLWADGSPGGEYVLRRPHRFRYPGNWKYQVENTVDGYHPRFVHESGFKALSQRLVGESDDEHAPRDLSTEFATEHGLTRGFSGGHSTLERPPGPDEPVVGLARFAPEVFERYSGQLIDRHGAERANNLRVNRHVFIFPNVFLMDVNVRVVHPLAPDLTEVNSYFAEASGVDAEVNSERLLDLQKRLGSTGLVGPDDMEVFARNQTALAAGRPEWLVFSRGIEAEIVDPLGEAVGTYSSETPQRAFWRRWSEIVEAEGREG